MKYCDRALVASGKSRDPACAFPAIETDLTCPGDGHSESSIDCHTPPLDYECGEGIPGSATVGPQVGEPGPSRTIRLLETVPRNRFSHSPAAQTLAGRRGFEFRSLKGRRPGTGHSF